MIAKDYRHDAQVRKDRKALLRALKPFGYAALAGNLVWPVNGPSSPTLIAPATAHSREQFQALLPV